MSEPVKVRLNFRSCQTPPWGSGIQGRSGGVLWAEAGILDSQGGGQCFGVGGVSAHPPVVPKASGAEQGHFQQSLLWIGLGWDPKPTGGGASMGRKPP